MFNLKGFEPVELTYDDHTCIETAVLENDSDALYNCGVPELTSMLGMVNIGKIKIDNVKLIIMQKINEPFYRSHIELYIQYLDENNLICRKSHRMKPGVDFNISEMATLWINVHEKFVPEFYHAELELLQAYMKQKFQLNMLQQELSDREYEQSNTPKNQIFAKYSTQLLTAVSFIIINNMDTKEFIKELTRLQICILISDNLKSIKGFMKLPEIKSDTELLCYDQGYHDALIDLLQNLQINHNFESFTNI